MAPLGMRVLFITTSYPASERDPRGTFIHVLARSLVEQGVGVTVLAPGAPGASRKERRDGVEIHRVTYWIPRWQTLTSGQGGIVENLRRHPWRIVQLSSLIGALSRKASQLATDADVVHAHWVYPAGVVGAVAARRTRRPLVVTAHGSDLNLAHRYGLLRGLVRWVARRAVVCTGVSETMVARYRDCGVVGTPLGMLPLGVDVTRPDPDEALRCAPEAKEFAEFRGLRVVCVGRLVPSKSVNTLLAAQHMLERDGRRCACLIIGDGPMRESLRSLARTSRESITVFVGSQPPTLIPSFLALGNAFAIPSLTEGRGLVAVEAMSLGLPVLASDIDALRELVTDRVNGLLFRPGSASELAERMVTLARDPDLCRTMGACSEAAFRRLGLGVRDSAGRHIALYREVTRWTEDKR